MTEKVDEATYPSGRGRWWSRATKGWLVVAVVWFWLGMMAAPQVAFAYGYALTITGILLVPVLGLVLVRQALRVKRRVGTQAEQRAATAGDRFVRVCYIVLLVGSGLWLTLLEGRTEDHRYFQNYELNCTALEHASRLAKGWQNYVRSKGTVPESLRQIWESGCLEENRRASEKTETLGDFLEQLRVGQCTYVGGEYPDRAHKKVILYVQLRPAYNEERAEGGLGEEYVGARVMVFWDDGTKEKIKPAALAEVLVRGGG